MAEHHKNKFSLTFRAAVLFRGQTTHTSSSLSPKRDCGSKRVKMGPIRQTVLTSCGIPFLITCSQITHQEHTNALLYVYTGKRGKDNERGKIRRDDRNKKEKNNNERKNEDKKNDLLILILGTVYHEVLTPSALPAPSTYLN